MGEARDKKIWKIFWKQALLFAAAHGLGLFVSCRLTTTARGQKIIKETAPAVISTAWGFLIYLEVITALFLLLIKTVKKNKSIFKVIFALALFGGIDVAFNTVILEPWAMFAAAGLVALRFHTPNIYLHNFVIAMAVAGASGTIGAQLNPQAVLFVLVGLMLYDIVAVYGTKHMMAMAKQMAQSGALFALVIPRKKTASSKIPEKLEAGGNYMMLGAGDLAVPLLLSTSVAKDYLLGGVVISLFALLGLAVMNLLFMRQEKPQAMPALPPVCLGAIVGYLVVLFL